MIKPVRFLAAAVICGFIVLHQDWWNWRSVGPFLFGMPIGLWYHVVYTLGASALMALLVLRFWPRDLDVPTDNDA